VYAALTLARHVDDHIHIDVHEAFARRIHIEFIVWPSPDEFCDIVEDEEDG
jgi:hypothetical protein